MKIRKPIVVAGVATALSIAAMAGGFAMASAADTGTASGPMSGLVTAIADKFHLNKDEVQQVFDQQRQQMTAQHQADIKTRLDQGVASGSITQTQEDLIVAKQAEIHAFMQTLKDMVPADRQAAIKKEMADVQQWVKDNAIPAQFMRMEMGMRGHGRDGIERNGGAPIQ